MNIYFKESLTIPAGILNFGRVSGIRIHPPDFSGTRHTSIYSAFGHARLNAMRWRQNDDDVISGLQ